MTDLNEKSTVELETELMNVDPKDLHTDQKGDDNDDSKADDGADDKDLNDDQDDKGGEDKGDDNSDDEPEKKDVVKGIKKVLTQRNEAREEVKSLKEELKEKDDLIKKIRNGEMDDEFDDEADKDLALIDAKQDKKLVERDIMKAEKGIDSSRNSELSDFLSKNPDLSDLQDDIKTFAKENPNLTVDHVAKLVIAELDPTRLLDEQTINKLKGGYSAGGRDSKLSTTNKSIDDLTTDEMESELEKAFG